MLLIIRNDFTIMCYTGSFIILKNEIYTNQLFTSEWPVIDYIKDDLFRDIIKRGCGAESARKRREEKIRKVSGAWAGGTAAGQLAEARIKATRELAKKPNSFLFGQTPQADSASLKLYMPNQSDVDEHDETCPSSV
ncbi:hypothetical protein DICVIV_07602 [Dictyocaulus viviparus]|uniref:Uncharacterized protein n=1 Tax=Dictyocaulus viviparus TaxID=29172 RepID=A0A0D8XVF1_DICVI|nr:hypothetical protein DICVIV_07602 [Dictyocaulus viviparus]